MFCGVNLCVRHTKRFFPFFFFLFFSACAVCACACFVDTRPTVLNFLAQVVNGTGWGHIRTSPPHFDLMLLDEVNWKVYDQRNDKISITEYVGGGLTHTFRPLQRLLSAFLAAVSAWERRSHPLNVQRLLLSA